MPVFDRLVGSFLQSPFLYYRWYYKHQGKEKNQDTDDKEYWCQVRVIHSISILIYKGVFRLFLENGQK